DTLSGTTGSDLIYGLAGNDTLYGCGGDDLIYGGDGNDVICLGGSGTSVVHGDGGNDTIIATAGTNDLYGDDGNDIIWGGSGDNILHGGAGGNILHGNEGDDTYVYTAGAADLIEESSTGGSDQIILPSGITSDDVTFSRVSTGDSTSYFYDLLISFSGGGSIQIANQFDGTSTSQVETLVFNDSSTIDLTALTNMTWSLTGGETVSVPYGSGDIYALVQGGGNYLTLYDGNNTVDFISGNNHVTGGSGDDTYIAGPGYNIIQETAGTNTIEIPTGYTMDDVTLSRVMGTYGPTSDLLVTIAGLGEFQLAAQYYASGYGIQNFHFMGDDSTVSLYGATIDTIGTSGDDSLSGLTVNVGGN